jgi:hypothetical protein
MAWQLTSFAKTSAADNRIYAIDRCSENLNNTKEH